MSEDAKRAQQDATDTDDSAQETAEKVATPTKVVRPADPERTLLSAEDHFARALSRAPDNLAVVTRLGALRERKDDYLGALDTYLDFACRWGTRVFEIRYRIAADLGMSDAWLTQLAADDFDRAMFGSRLRAPRSGEGAAKSRFCLEAETVRILTTVLSDATPETVHAGLLDAATSEWRSLRRFLALPRSVWRLLVALVRRQAAFNDAGYQARFVQPGQARRERRQLVRLAGLATEVQRLAPWPVPLGSADRLRRSALRRSAIKTHGSSAAVEYTRACVIARIYELSGEREDSDRALDALQAVMQSGTTDTWIASIGNDPDLAALRRTTRFRRWWHELAHGSEPSPFAWLRELSTELERRWTLHADLMRSSRPAQSIDGAVFALQRDADCHAYLSAACDGTIANHHRRQAEWRVVTSAADLHARVEPPEETLDYVDQLRSPRHVEGYGWITLSELIETVGVERFDGAPRKRAEKWRRIGEQVRVFEASRDAAQELVMELLQQLLTSFFPQLVEVERTAGQVAEGTTRRDDAASSERDRAAFLAMAEVIDAVRESQNALAGASQLDELTTMAQEELDGHAAVLFGFTAEAGGLSESARTQAMRSLRRRLGADRYRELTEFGAGMRLRDAAEYARQATSRRSSAR